MKQNMKQKSEAAIAKRADAKKKLGAALVLMTAIVLVDYINLTIQLSQLTQ